MSLRGKKLCLNQCAFYILCEGGDKDTYLCLFVYASRNSGRIKAGIIHKKFIMAVMGRSGIDNV